MGAWRERLRLVGPGILFAGACIGVSHLVQSTRAGAGYGFDLLGVVALVLIFKYPFFQYAHRYTVATGECLLDGYRRLGTWALGLFMLVVVVSSFITLAAVTVVTAGLMGALLGLDLSMAALSLILLLVILGILALGHYRLLDGLMKVMVVVLGLLTLVAVAVAAGHGPAGDPAFPKPDPWSAAGLTFLLALMGWMPAPLDIGAWTSLWILEKNRGSESRPTLSAALLDFHLGYGATAVLAAAFISFGALVMFGTGVEFAAGGLGFARQLVDMYTATLGGWSRWIIALVAFITMFSTTLAVLDGYGRTLAGGLHLLLRPAAPHRGRDTLVAMVVLVVLAEAIIAFFMTGMRALVDVATVLAFLTAPLVAVLNFQVVRAPHVPASLRPGPVLTVWSWAGILFLAGFGLVWAFVRWLA